MKIEFCTTCRGYTERQADGRCEPCCAKLQKSNPERAATAAKWYANNLLVVREKMVSKAALKKKQRADNREKAAAQREKDAANRQKWRIANPERCAVSGRNRRARRKAALGTHTAEDICAIATYQNKLCACCAISIKGGYHVDHIKALSRGGSNDRQNLQLLCQKCNLRKNAKHPIEFMQASFPEMVKSWAAALLNRREVLGF